MKFGVREICDVVLKAKATQKVGNKLFYKHEPVIYFDTLKTSSMEGAATTVYAQGGKGNSRLMAWEGERTVTFTMEDALISPEGFMILSGAGLIEAGGKRTVYKTEDIEINAGVITLSSKAVDKESITVTIPDGKYGIFTLRGSDEGAFTLAEDSKTITIDAFDDLGTEFGGESNPIATVSYKTQETSGDIIVVHTTEQTDKVVATTDKVTITLDQEPYQKDDENLIYVMVLDDNGNICTEPYCTGITVNGKEITISSSSNDLTPFNKSDCVVFVDYYVAKESGAKQIEITPDKFGGNYYLEASTLFRGTNGVDMPAEFIIPNCKIQSNFTFTMAGSGDPSTFTFTMDAFPDYTRFDKTKKVLAAIQIVDAGNDEDIIFRTRTAHDPSHETYLQ